MSEHFNPLTLFKPEVYCQAVKAGNLVFTAGQCSTAPGQLSVGKGDPYIQARQCHQNVKLALEAAGASMQDVVKINTYSTLDEYRKIVLEVRKEFFKPPYPASAGVVVTGLAYPTFLYEIEVVAILGEKKFYDPSTLRKPDEYSQVVRAGNIVYSAGHCATAPDASRVGRGNPYVQARHCYENLRAALEAAGASMQDVVKIGTYSTHPQYQKILNAARSEFFEPPYPASTDVIITCLARPEFLFEVEAVAALGPREYYALQPSTLAKPEGYSLVVKAGNIVYVSGQYATASDGTLVGRGDPYAQAKQCYQNLQAALEVAGASMQNVVKINTYSTNEDYRWVLIRSRPQFFEPPYPASTGVVVTGLPRPDFMFGVDAMAIIDK
ncbi:MAG: RidA family protein [Dehalococcoidia bacterium]